MRPLHSACETHHVNRDPYRGAVMTHLLLRNLVIKKEPGKRKSQGTKHLPAGTPHIVIVRVP